MVLLVGCGDKSIEETTTTTTTLSSELALHNQTTATTPTKIERGVEKKTQAPTVTETTATKKIGTEEVGYITVPSSWGSISTELGHLALSPTRESGITVHKFSKVRGFDLVSYAETLDFSMTSKDQTAQIELFPFVKFGEYETVGLIATYPKEDYKAVAWIFQSEDGEYRCIVAEGHSDAISEAITYVEQYGWTLTD